MARNSPLSPRGEGEGEGTIIPDIAVSYTLTSHANTGGFQLPCHRSVRLKENLRTTLEKRVAYRSEN